MNNRDNGKQDLLISLLKPLVTEWGFSVVMRNLKLLNNHPDLNDIDGTAEEGTPNSISSSKRVKNATISSLISAKGLSEEKSHLISLLASNFNKKTFLPKMSDVRMFFELHGKHFPEGMQRAKILVPIIEIIAGEPVANIVRISKEGNFWGPMELGPLSDAINATGANHRLGKATYIEHSVEQENDFFSKVQIESNSSDKKSDTLKNSVNEKILNSGKLNQNSDEKQKFLLVNKSVENLSSDEGVSKYIKNTGDENVGPFQSEFEIEHPDIKK